MDFKTWFELNMDDVPGYNAKDPGHRNLQDPSHVFSNDNRLNSSQLKKMSGNNGLSLSKRRTIVRGNGANYDASTIIQKSDIDGDCEGKIKNLEKRLDDFEVRLSSIH